MELHTIGIDLGKTVFHRSGSTCTARSELFVTQESRSRMPSMPAYTPRRAEKRHRQLILLPRGHPPVSGEELGESRLTKLRGTHLTETTEHSCEVLLGLESTCNGYIEDACIFFY